MEKTSNNVFKGDFIPYIIRWGRGTNLLGVILAFGPCLVLAIQGILPNWAALGAGLAMQLPLSASAYIREPISYFAMLGVPGTYMAFLSGNIANLRVPCCTIATKSAGLEEGTDKGTISATIGCATSTFVSTTILTIGVIFSAWLLEVLPAIVTAALNLLLPALFGSMLSSYAFRKPKLAYIVIPATFFVYFLHYKGFTAFIPSVIRSAVPQLFCSFGSMFLGVKMATKK